MTYPAFSDLGDVQEQVNRLPYRSDAERYGKEDFWSELDKDGGDCEDFAIAKYRRLLALGWPAESLRLACCYVETGEYHAVLIVSTSEGDFMLDNRKPHPVAASDIVGLCGYKSDMIQGSGQTWVEWME